MTHTLSPEHAALLASLPYQAEHWYWQANAAYEAADPDDTIYGTYLTDDPRRFVPDLDCNTRVELERWAEACQRAALGDNIVATPTQPDHAYGCTADHSLGLGISVREQVMS